MNAEQRDFADPSNAGQAQAWNGDDGAFWTAQARHFDLSLTNCQGPFLAAADVRPADRVLDVGCGTGQTSRDAARAATRGSVQGIDLSSQMIALAKQTALADGLGNAEFLQGDAQIHPFASNAFDLVISRMGSMFFGDPPAAFANLHRALRPGGRLTLLTWQALAHNEWMTELRAAMAVGRELPSPPPGVPGPFAFADPERVTTILADAGFTDISFQDLQAPMIFGTDAADALAFVDSLTGWMANGLDAAGRAAAHAALRQTVADHTGPAGVTFRCATWIVQASRPVASSG